MCRTNDISELFVLSGWLPVQVNWWGFRAVRVKGYRTWAHVVSTNAVLLHCQLLPRFELDTDFGAAIQRKATQASAKAAITRERLLPVHCVPSIAVAPVGLRG